MLRLVISACIWPGGEWCDDWLRPRFLTLVPPKSDDPPKIDRQFFLIFMGDLLVTRSFASSPTRELSCAVRNESVGTVVR